MRNLILASINLMFLGVLYFGCADNYLGNDKKGDLQTSIKKGRNIIRSLLKQPDIPKIKRKVAFINIGNVKKGEFYCSKIVSLESSI